MGQATIGDLTAQTGVGNVGDLLEIQSNAGDSKKVTASDLRQYPLGDGPAIQTGSNAKSGVGTMSAGAASIATTAATANSQILLTPIGTGTGSLSVGTITPTSGFTMTSSDGSDVRNFLWVIIELFT